MKFKYLETIEDIGQVIWSQRSVCMDAWSCPPNSHLSHCYRLKLKVPFSLGYGVGFLCPEHTDLITPTTAIPMPT